MAGVVLVLEFSLVFPDQEFGCGEDAGLEVGVDDAGLAFGGRGAVGLASILPRGGDLLLSAHKKAFPGRSGRPALQKERAAGRDCPFDPTVASTPGGFHRPPWRAAPFPLLAGYRLECNR